MEYRISSHLEEMVNAFSERFGPLEDIAEIAPLLEEKGFHDRSEALDNILLLAYILGKRPIKDKDGKARYIASIDDLSLLSHSVVFAGKKEHQAMNPELINLYYRINMRYSRIVNVNWESIINSILAESEVIKYLGGKASYEDVNGYMAAERRDNKTIREYILGNRAILDGEGNKRTIASIEDLVLLVPGVILLKSEDNRRINPELASVYYRVATRNFRYRRPNWERIVDNILAEDQAVQYFGNQATYEDVTGWRVTERQDIKMLREYILGKRTIIGEDNDERHITSFEDLNLLAPSSVRANPGLFDLYNRIATRNSRLDRPNWREMINRIFTEKSTIEYLDGVADYRINCLG